MHNYASPYWSVLLNGQQSLYDLTTCESQVFSVFLSSDLDASEILLPFTTMSEKDGMRMRNDLFHRAPVQL